MTGRRDVLWWLATGAALPLVGRLVPGDAVAFGRRVHASTQQGGDASWQALDEATGRLLIAACEGILPASDTPGATDAGVARFIDRMLAGWYPASERDALVAGLRTLDARSRERYARAFSEIVVEDQAPLLTALDEEAHAKGEGATHWFAELKELTIWGYFTSEIVVTSILHESPMGAGRYEGCVPLAANPESPSS
jgi:gluconate 2-dehydrogenase gamma chain